MNKYKLWFSVACVALMLGNTSANARAWSHSPIALAQDYSVISDNRGNGEVVSVFWLTSQMIPKTPTNQPAIDMLDRYVLIGVVHAHMAKDGVPTFEPITDLVADDGADRPLKLMTADTIPPTMAGGLATIKAVFSRVLGPLGAGTYWFIFDSGDIHACSKGKLSIPIAGETYTFDTPIPGCS